MQTIGLIWAWMKWRRHLRVWCTNQVKFVLASFDTHHNDITGLCLIFLLVCETHLITSHKLDILGKLHTNMQIWVVLLSSDQRPCEELHLSWDPLHLRICLCSALENNCKKTNPEPQHNGPQYTLAE